MIESLNNKSANFAIILLLSRGNKGLHVEFLIYKEVKCILLCALFEVSLKNDFTVIVIYVHTILICYST